MRYGEYPDPTDMTTLPTDIREIPMTGESMGYQTQSISSQNINSSRQILDTIQTGYEVSGGVQIEMAPKIWDDLIQGALWANWQTTPVEEDAEAITVDHDNVDPTTARTITTTTEVFDVVGTATDKIKEGQYFQLRVEDSASIPDALAGIYQVDEVLAADSCTVKQVDGATPFKASTTATTGDKCKLRASMIRAPKANVYLFQRLLH